MGKGKKKSKTNSNGSTEQAPAGATQDMRVQKPDGSVPQKRGYTADDELAIKNDEKGRSDRRVSDLESNQDRSYSREYQGSKYKNKGDSDAGRNRDFGRRSEPSRRSEQVDDRDKTRHSVGNEHKRIARDRSHSGGRNYRSRDYRQDREFIASQKEFDLNRGNIPYVKIKEIVYNLFDMSQEYSLAHCVAEDMNMGSGIAVQFRRDFKRVDELLNQRQRTGGLAILKQEGRFIYYLVTKRFSWGKPTNSTLFASLKRLRDHVIENNVKLIAMPRIGCGLDRLEWDEVKFMMEFVFQEVDVEITICNYEMAEDSPQQKFRNCKVTNVLYPIQNIEAETVILYFSSEDGSVSEEMTKLDEKFQHLREFRIARRSLGNVVFYTKNQQYLLCGCIVRKSEKDPFDFEALQKCVSSIQKENKRTKFYYAAFQAFVDPGDSTINYKIINLLRNSLREIEVYVCWPGDLQNQMAPKDRFDDYTSGGGGKSADKDAFSFRQSSGGRDWRPSGDKRSTQYGTKPIAKRGSWDNERAKTDESKNSSSWQNNTWDSEKTETDESKNFSSLQNDTYWDPEKTETNESKNSSAWDNVGHWDDKLESQQNDNSYGNPGTTQESTAKIGRKAIDEEPQNTLSRNRSRQTSSHHWCEDVEEMSVLTSKGKDKELDQSTTEVESMSLRSGTEKSEDPEYLQFESKLQAGLIECRLVKEQSNQKSLKNYSIVCFAREDMLIVGGVPDGSDVGPHVGKLLNQNKRVGGLACISEGTGFYYFLIVQTPNSPPNYQAVFFAIRNLRNHVQKHSVKKLVIPKMVSGGSDKFDWSKVNYMFQFIFGRGNVDIICARFDPAYDVVSLQKKNKSELKHGKSPIHQMKKKSVILYLASLEGCFTEEMKGLAKKFPDFLEDFTKKTKSLGDVIQYKENEDYVLCGCVVKVRDADSIDFEDLRQSVVKVNERNTKKEKLPNVGFQAVNDDQEWTNYKIATILLNCLQDVTISMCWPGNLRTKMPSNRS